MNTKLIAFLTIIGTIAGPILVPLILTPVITFDVNYETIQDQTNVKIKINNIGLSPATDVRITINPGLEFLEPTKITHYTDEIFIDDNGPQSNIGEMKRLSNSQHVSIVTSHNTTLTDLTSYSVVVTHDAGSSTYTKSSLNIFDGISFWLLISIIFTLIASIFLMFFNSKKNTTSDKSNISGNNSSSKDPPASENTSKSNNIGIIPDLQTRLSTLENKFTDLTIQLGVNPELIENQKLSFPHEKINEINSILDEAKEIKNKLYEKKISLPVNINFELLIATYDYHIDNPEKSLQHLDNILKHDPDNWIALSNKGVTLSKLGKHHEALSSYKKALEIEPNNTIILNNIATQFTDHLGDNHKAIEYLDRALEIDPNSSFTHYHKGNALFHLRKYKESDEFANIALEKTPNDPSVLCLKGICVGTLQGPEESLKYFDKALKINPDFFFALTNKAATLQRLNRLDEALEYVDKALKIKPNDPIANTNKEMILKMLNSKS